MLRRCMYAAAAIVSGVATVIVGGPVSAAGASGVAGDGVRVVGPERTAGTSDRAPGLTFGEPEFLTPRQPGGDVYSPAVSGDGSVVAFVSTRSDLVATDLPGYDVFFHVNGVNFQPYTAEQMRRPLGDSYSAGCAGVSRDGRYITFCTTSPKLIPGNNPNGLTTLFVYDRQTGSQEPVSLTGAGIDGAYQVQGATAISADGRYVAFGAYSPTPLPGDRNKSLQVFVRDRLTQTTTLASVSATGHAGNRESGRYLAISGDGRYVAFTSEANNLVAHDTNMVQDAFVHDRLARTTERVNLDGHGGQMSWNLSQRRLTYTLIGGISDDGRYVVFASNGVGIGGVPLDSRHSLDVFVRDRKAATTTLLSQRGGVPAGSVRFHGAFLPSITPDGGRIAFISNSPVLSPFSDTEVVYVYEKVTGALSRAPGKTTDASITADGRTIVYVSRAPQATSGALARRTVS